MKPALTLEYVADQFATWRKNKISRKEMTPLVLKSQAVALLDLYRANKIRAALGIAGNTLKQWALELNPADDNEFVALPGTEDLVVDISVLTQKNDITCVLPNGITLSFTADQFNHRILFSLFSCEVAS